MINEERFWESAIQEAVHNESPPDVTARVLAGLADPEPPAEKVATTGSKPRLFRIAAEFAVAAAVVFAIGWLTGVLRLPETVSDRGSGESLEVAAAPGTDYEIAEGNIELREGWLLVVTGTPSVHCGGSTLEQVDGRVLVHASGVPTREQAEAVLGWLNANRLEIEMVGAKKNWAKGTALAALVLSGSAMLDGQKVEGPKPEGTATAEWHVVRSVMDIDNLPKGARFVNADGLNAAHLDFLAEVESLQGIRLRNGVELRVEHLKGLAVLKNLQWLDIRGTGWAQEANLSALTDLPALKRIGADLIPAAYRERGHLYKYADGYEDYYQLGQLTYYQGGDETGNIAPVNFDYRQKTLPTLSALSSRGVEIELGRWRPITQEDVAGVLGELPTMSSIIVDAPSAGVMKMLAAHEKLKSLELLNYDAGQIGLAYLARKATLEELSIAARWLSLEEIHQLSRMKLRFLHIDGGFSGSPEQCFERLAGMKDLRELELWNLDLQDDNWATAMAALSKFGAMQRLDRLVIDDCSLSPAFMAAHLVPARRLELQGSAVPIWSKSDVPESVLKGTAGKHLEEIRFELEDADLSDENMSDECAASLKSYPNLKRIEVRRGGFNQPSMEDQFVNWLKASLPGVEVVLTP